MPETQRPPVASPKGPPLSTVALLAGLAAIGTLSTTIVLPVFPQISAQMQVDPRDVGLLLSAFFLAFAVMQLIAGPLSDRYGRRPPIFLGLTCFLCGTALCAFATSFDVLVFGRIVQAIGISAPFVLSRAIARDKFEGLALARTLSFVMVAMSAAPGFSPLLGSALGSAFGWRSTFVFVGLAAAVLMLSYIRMGETHHADRRAADSIGTILRAYHGLLTDRRFILPAVTVALVMGALNTVFGTAPVVLQYQLGLSPTQMGLFFAGTVFVVFAFGLLAPGLARRFGQTNVATLGVMIACGGALLLLLLSRQPNFIGYLVGVTVFLAGMGIINPLGTALTLQPFGARAGLASSLLGAMQMLFAGLCVTVAGRLPLPAPPNPFTALGWVMSAAMILASLAMFFVWLCARRPSPTVDPTLTLHSEVSHDA